MHYAYKFVKAARCTNSRRGDRSQNRTDSTSQSLNASTTRCLNHSPVRRSFSEDGTPQLLLDFAAEFFFELGVGNLDHGRPAVRTAVGQIAREQILDQLFDFEIAQRVVRLDRVATNGFRDHFLTQT